MIRPQVEQLAHGGTPVLEPEPLDADLPAADAREHVADLLDGQVLVAELDGVAAEPRRVPQGGGGVPANVVPVRLHHARAVVEEVVQLPVRREPREVLLRAGQHVVDVDDGGAEDRPGPEAGRAHDVLDFGLGAVVVAQVTLLRDVVVPQVPVPRGHGRAGDDALEAGLLRRLHDGLGLLGFQSGDRERVEIDAHAALRRLEDVVEIRAFSLEDCHAWALQDVGNLRGITHDRVDFCACGEEVFDGPLTLMASCLGDEVGGHCEIYLSE